MIRVIEIDMDLDLTPVERVSRMLAKGYLYGSHFLPHDAMATQKSGWNSKRPAWLTSKPFRGHMSVRTGFRGDVLDSSEPDILERFFGRPRANVRVIR